MIQTERELKVLKIREQMQRNQLEACIVSTPVNTYYLHQCIFQGYTYIPLEGEVFSFVRRPSDFNLKALQLQDGHCHFIRKPEQIIEVIQAAGLTLPASLGLEGEEMPQSQWARFEKMFATSQIKNISHLLRQARSVKTEYELEQIRQSARLHEAVYRNIPSIYRPGMSEKDFCIEIEYQMRKGGCLGLFRCYGIDMESFMGSVVAGDNAAASSPYDFALGGAGHPSNPIGATQDTALREGQSILVDMCGNFSGYLDDLSRCYSLGKLPDIAYKAHQTALDIQAFIQENMKPGVICEDLYNGALKIAQEAGMAEYFMGCRQQAKFVGHGVGLVINELPVLAPRMKEPLQAGMVLAVEPKMVIEGIGAVGVENTFIVTENGGEKLVSLSDEIIDLLA